MTKRDKILIAISLIGIAILALITYSVSNKIANLENTITNLASTKSVSPIAIKGDRGNDGDSIVGPAGLNGKDSTSTVTKEVIIKEVPLLGADGKDGAPGKDAEEHPVQMSRVNPETKDFETKMSNWDEWFVMIPCAELMRICPGDVISKPVEAL